MSHIFIYLLLKMISHSIVHNSVPFGMCLYLSVCLLQGIVSDPHMALALPSDKKKKKSSLAGLCEEEEDEEEQMSIRIGRAGVHSGKLFFTIPLSSLTR